MTTPTRTSGYDQYASDTALLLAGCTLLHGDINPDNLLVAPDGNVIIVDWSWPTHGAAFIDPACLAVQLIAAGHDPAQAEAWAARCTAWRETDPAALDAPAAPPARGRVTGRRAHGHVLEPELTHCCLQRGPASASTRPVARCRPAAGDRC